MQVAEVNPTNERPGISNRRRGADREPSDRPGYSGPERRTGVRRTPSETLARPEDLLEPIYGDHFLVVPVILFRIQQSFAYMVADEEVGRLHVEQLKQDIYVNTHNVIERTKRLEKLEEIQNQAVYVRWGDNPGSELEYLSTVLIPGELIRINYESVEHRECSRSLLQKFSGILDYRIAN